MDLLLKTNVITWLKTELPGYIMECGGEYRSYIIEDAISEFNGWDNTALEEQIRSFCREVLDGDI